MLMAGWSLERFPLGKEEMWAYVEAGGGMERLQMGAGRWGRGVLEQMGVNGVLSSNGMRPSSGEGGRRHGGEER